MIIKYDYKIIFDPIPVGTEASQSFIVENGQNYKDWNFLQYSEFEPSLNAFTLKKKVTKYGNKEKHEILITYQPLQPEQTNINYYKLTNYGENEKLLYVSGYASGLSVYATVKYLNFYRSPKDNKIKTTFEIHNKSICKINYQLEIDNNQKIFEIHPKKGSIAPGRYIYVSVEFIIEKIGVFFMDIPCLINFHSPIYIELFGVNSSIEIEPELKTIHGQVTQISLDNNYEKYFSETLGLLDSNPICYLGSKYLYFSLSEDRVFCLPELINLTDKCLLIMWDFEQDGSVVVSPKEFYIRPQERSCFEVKFDPKMYENLYGGFIYGRGFIFGEKQSQLDPETIVVPLSLRYIGNTFMKTQVWIPQVQFQPETLTMPPCLSKFSVYNTLKIKKLGQYPILFEFRAPPNTRFRVKPMLGIINKGFQIVLIKFTGGTEVNEIVEEKWKIILNQNEKIYSEITLRAFVQDPMLVVNVNNQIEFGPQFPGFKKYVTVPFENITQNKIKYIFYPNKWYTLDKTEGILDSFSSTELTFCLTCDCDLPNSCYMKYDLNVLLQNIIISKVPYVKKVELISKCAYGTLCSSPSSHNFETMVCGVEVTKTFNIFNFAEPKMHFLLQIHGHYGVTDENPVTVTPIMGSIPSGGHQEVTVSICTSFSTLSTYCIFYHLCETEGSDKLVDGKGNYEWVLFRGLF